MKEPALSVENPALAMNLTGIHALDASAGTGKTYSIALVYLRLVLKGVSVDRILVTTFTEAAASELRERLRLRLVEARDELIAKKTEDQNLVKILGQARGDAKLWRERLDDALSCFDQAPICTIHGFCYRLIRDHVLELGANVEGELMSEDPRLKQLAGDLLAKIAFMSPVGDDETEEPEVRKLVEVARKIREYGLPAPAGVPLSALQAQAEGQWGAEELEARTDALQAWNEQGKEIEQTIRLLVGEGKISHGVFDNPDKDGDARWKKLSNSVSEVKTLLSNPLPPDEDFGAGPKRLLPGELLSPKCALLRDDVTAFLRKHSFFSRLDRLRELVKEHGNSIAATRGRFLWQEFLEKAASLRPGAGMLFSDLINNVFNSLNNGPFIEAVRDNFEAVLVDECQDTDARQLEIFRSLFADTGWIGDPPARCLIWVGDPKQSIYRFRGADIETYIRAKNGAAGGVLTLNVNYRSDKPLVAAVNSLFHGPCGVDVFGSGITYGDSLAEEGVRIRQPDGTSLPAFRLHMWDAGPEPDSKTAVMGPVLRDCARRIKELLDSGIQIKGKTWKTIAARDIAVLAPTHKQLEIVRRELRLLNIPSAYQVDASVYLSDEARDLSLLLRALSAPRLADVKAALCTPFLGYSVNEVAGIGEGELAQHITRIQELAERLKSEGFLSVLFSLLRDESSFANEKKQAPALVRLAGTPEGERVLTNCIQLGELLQEAWGSGHARSAEALKDFLDQAIANADELSGAESGEAAKLRLETDAPAVVLSTIHKSKGLQYPVVFLPMIWSQSAVQQPPCIVSHQADGKCDLVLPGDPQWTATFRDEKKRLEAEQMRLLYVALTRGKHQVHVWWGRVKNASRWTVSSTRAAFGRLIFKDPMGVESYTDFECREAVKAALSRNQAATFDIVELHAAVQSFGIPTQAGLAGAGAGEEDRKLEPAPWLRRCLPAEPLQSSYSALLRKKPEAHRAEDEPPVSGEGEPDDPPPDARVSAVPVVDILEPYQAGKVLGDRVHCAFETALSGHDVEIAGKRFALALSSDLPALLRSGEVEPAHGDVALALWAQTVDARLFDGKVGDLLKGPHVPEWEYLLPQGTALTPSALADVMKCHGGGSPWGKADYIKRVSELKFVPLNGYFEGIVDLLGRLPDGRWVLADYKTNRLKGYGSRNLESAMAESHYLLQALLYAVAVKRWLKRSVTGWTYDDGFAGTAYLFLRGMKAGTAEGIWLDKPPAALVKALDTLFTEKGAAKS